MEQGQEVNEEDDMVPPDHQARRHIGVEVRRHFLSSGWANGKVTQIYFDEDSKPLYHVKYKDDGDTEDLNEKEYEEAMAEAASPCDVPPFARPKVSV